MKVVIDRRTSPTVVLALWRETAHVPQGKGIKFLWGYIKLRKIINIIVVIDRRKLPDQLLFYQLRGLTASCSPEIPKGTKKILYFSFTNRIEPAVHAALIITLIIKTRVGESISVYMLP